MSLGSQTDLSESSDTFCILPFTHLSTMPDGDILLCCRSHPKLGNIRETSLKEVWNSNTMREVRRQLLSGERPSQCRACFRDEDLGMHSQRLSMLKFRMPKFPDSLSRLNLETFEMPFEVPVLELKLSNLCNLRCRMCNPGNSSRWLKDYLSLKAAGAPVPESSEQWLEQPLMDYFTPETSFQDDFLRLAPHFETLEFAGGEPLLDPLHYQILETVKDYAPKINLKYSTNLTSLGGTKFDALSIWKQFKSVELTVSVDGTSGVFEYIRTGAKLTEVEDNYRAFRKAFPKSFVRFSCTVQAYNVSRLPEIFDYFTRDLGVMIHSSKVTWPAFLSTKVLPPKMKLEIQKKFLSFLEKFDQYSASIDLPPDRLVKFKKHLEDHLKFMLAEDHYEKYWPEFIKYTQELDRIRGTNLIEAMPEFEGYFNHV